MQPGQQSVPLRRKDGLSGNRFEGRRNLRDMAVRQPDVADNTVNFSLLYEHQAFLLPNLLE